MSGVSSDMRELLASEEPARASRSTCSRTGRGVSWLARGGARRLDAIVFTAGIGENQPEVRRRICADAQWLGVELDAAANERTDRASARRAAGGCVGRADRRGNDDRAARGAAATLSAPPAPGLEQVMQCK